MSSDYNLKENFIITIFMLIFLIGVAGNSLVIYIFVRKQRRSSMELMIIYLAITDLVASIMNPFLYIYWHLTEFEQWHFGSFCCTLFPLLTTVSVTMSLGLILLITIERCRIITNPFNGLFNKMHVHYMVLLVLCISVLNELPYILHQTVNPIATVKYNCIKTHFDEHTTQTDYIYQEKYTEDCGSAVTSYLKNITTPAATIITTAPTKSLPLTPTITALTATITSPISNLSKTTTATTTTTKNNTVVVEITCKKIYCKQITQCSPTSTKAYMFSRSATLILRDVVFVLTFVVCNCVIYWKLMDEEHRAALKETNFSARLDQRRTFKMLLTLALVFSILVLPKDIFTVIYTMSYASGKPISNKHALDINSALKLLQSFNSVANIFIYDKLHVSFKVALKSTIESKFQNLSF